MAAAALALLGGCKKQLDADKLVAGIERDLGKQLGVPFASVTCPGDRKLERGDRFTCTGTAGGLPIVIEVEQVSADGDVHMRARGVVVVRKLTDQIAQKLREAGQDVVVDCGPAPLRAVRQGDHFECKLTPRAGEVVVVEVTATDDYGGTEYQPR